VRKKKKKEKEDMKKSIITNIACSIGGTTFILQMYSENFSISKRTRNAIRKLRKNNRFL